MLLWNALTAIGTLTLAIATFVVIWQDRSIEKESKKPNLILTDVRAELLTTETLANTDVDTLRIQLTVVNLGNYPLRIREVTVTKTFVVRKKESLTDKTSVNIVLAAGQAKPAEVLVHLQEPANTTLETESFFYKELRIYFQYGPTGQNYHRVALSFIKFIDDHFIFGEDQELTQNVKLENKTAQGSNG